MNVAPMFNHSSKSTDHLDQWSSKTIFGANKRDKYAKNISTDVDRSKKEFPAVMSGCKPRPLCGGRTVPKVPSLPTSKAVYTAKTKPSEIVFISTLGLQAGSGVWGGRRGSRFPCRVLLYCSLVFVVLHSRRWQLQKGGIKCFLSISRMRLLACRNARS